MFETVLVQHGIAVALEAHLARLRASATELYGQDLASDLASRIRALAAAMTARARVRVNVRASADGGIAAAEIVVSEAPVRTQPPRLTPVVVPGGIGGHKWIDRRLVDALSASVAPAHPVICDLDGYVLETARANVFVLTREGTLVTPPTDGRILPGVTRHQALDCAAELGIAIEVRPLHIDELRGAPEVFLTGSLSGIEPALAAGNDRPPGAGNLTETLRTNLYKTMAPAILR